MSTATTRVPRAWTSTVPGAGYRRVKALRITLGGDVLVSVADLSRNVSVRSIRNPSAPADSLLLYRGLDTYSPDFWLTAEALALSYGWRRVGEWSLHARMPICRVVPAQ